MIEEGQETSEFWGLLGGESVYYDKNPDRRIEPRLFQCCEATGIVMVFLSYFYFPFFLLTIAVGRRNPQFCAR